MTFVVLTMALCSSDISVDIVNTSDGGWRYRNEKVNYSEGILMWFPKSDQVCMNIYNE